jgi:hypothetical protein
MGAGTLEAHYEGQAGNGLQKYNSHFQRDLAVAGEAFGDPGIKALGKELASPAASPGLGIRDSMAQVGPGALGSLRSLKDLVRLQKDSAESQS